MEHDRNFGQFRSVQALQMDTQRSCPNKEDLSQIEVS